MRLIYDGGPHEVVTCEHIVFRGGRVTGEVADSIGEKLIAQPHLKIRKATAKEIAAKDEADGPLPAPVAKAFQKAEEAANDFAAKLDATKTPTKKTSKH